MKPDLVPGTPAYDAYLASLTGPAPVAHERKAQVRRTQTAAPGECWRCGHFREQRNDCAVLVAVRAFCPFHSERQAERRTQCVSR
jgi:hypothetical protein